MSKSFFQTFLWFKFRTSFQICIYWPTFVIDAVPLNAILELYAFWVTVDILVSFCNFVFLRKQKTKELPAFEVQYERKKALLASKI